MGNTSLLKAKPKKPKGKDIANLLGYKFIIVSDLWSQSPLPYVSLSGVHSQWLIKIPDPPWSIFQYKLHSSFSKNGLWPEISYSSFMILFY